MGMYAAMCVAEASIHWCTIQVLKKSPKHDYLGFYRVGIGIMFLLFFHKSGVMWYWAAAYIIFAHLTIFNEALNIFRGKDVGYLDIDHDSDEEEDSTLDPIFYQIGRGQLGWLALRLILLLAFTANLIWYGNYSITKWIQLL